MAQTRKKSRKSHNSRDQAWGPWAELTGHLLVSVILRLGFMDCVSIAGVCRPWRRIVTGNRETILEQQRPLVVVKSTHAKKACFLYNMYDQIRYKTLLPDYLSYWRFVGLSCGYLIMLNLDSKFWLLNLITRDELHFPALPQFFFFGLFETLPILIYSTDISDHFMLVVNRKMSSMVLSQRGGANWRTIPYTGKDGTFVDLTFFNESVYVLTRDGRIGKLRLSPYLLLELLDVSISIPKSSFTPLQFATSKDCLLMVSLFRHSDGSFKMELVIHKLDEANMEWVKVNDMGDEAVFLSPIPGGSAVVNPAKWGGGSNCIYDLKSMFNSCTIFPLNSSQGLLKGTTVVPEPRGALVPQFWYFPHLCYKRNSIKGSLVV